MIPIQILLLSSALLLTSCHSNRQLVGTGSVKDLTDSIWTYGVSHPDGFTLDINTMTEPVFVLSEGREVRLDTQHRSPDWDYQYEYWSFIPAKMRAEYLYDRMNEMCPNSVVAVHIRYELLKEWEEIPNQTPYKVLMICRKH